MESDPTKMDDAEVQALAQAEREAGVPDQQTATAAAQAKERQVGAEGESRRIRVE